MSDAADATARVRDGRYLFCAVAVDRDRSDGDAGAEGGDGRAAFPAEATGIEGGAVSLIVHDGVGAVVQSVDDVFDSEDPAQVRRWLLSHQEVVDEAGRAFGTPVPFRFDTVVDGGDEGVREWLRARHATLDDALSRLAGRWEYRITVTRDEEAVAARIRETDDDLRALAERVDTASEGTGYLLERRYRQRVDDRLADRRRRLADTVVDRVDPHAVAVRRADPESGAGLVGGDPDDDDDRAVAVRLSVLASEANEDRIGEELAAVAERPAHDVRYTGPWPPYTFAPQVVPEQEVGDDGGTVDRDGDAAADGHDREDAHDGGDPGA